MRFALTAVAAETDSPVVAVTFTPTFIMSAAHRLSPTWLATFPSGATAGVVGNRQRNSSEVGPVARSGLVHQFGITLPAEGAPDALVNVGLGLSFRNAEHAPFTEGFLYPTDTFDTPTTASIAGLIVEMTPAPSDADDSITIWFPELSVCINNIVWPVLFNVFSDSW